MLQARTNSSRLPGKVLLPVNGVPLAVLAAKRASNTGREVVIATSWESTDDALAELVSAHGIRCYRGSLENTLGRIVAALDEYQDETLVFRLTADNVFPDGPLLDEMEEEFVKYGLDYLCCNGEKSGLPYGMSAELTRLCHLREAAISAYSKHDLEHVTPFVRRKFGENYFEKYKALGKGDFRCTVDCLDDYVAVTKVFSAVDDPVQVSAFELVRRLSSVQYQPIQSKQVKKLVLGTAQLGLSYGIANQLGKPDQATAEKLVKTAIVNGASYIDTARAYGDSEEVIGNALKSGWEGRARVITKLSPLADCPPDAAPQVVDAFIDASIYKSCTALRMQSLDVLMLHRAAHMRSWNGRAWARLLEYKACSAVKALGVSVQDPQELNMALDAPDVEFIQMPFNVLDWRWDHLVPKIRMQKKQRRLLIHARSALLQGLLPSGSVDDWQKANVLEPELFINWLDEQCRRTGRSSIADFCLSFVKSLDWVDGLVVGMESLGQLQENIKILDSADFSREDLEAILAARPSLGVESLNPACWR